MSRGGGVRYFIILAVVFNFLFPQIVEIGSYYSDLFTLPNEILNNINMKYVGGYSTYFLLGWYLRFNDIKRKNFFYVLGLLSIVTGIIMTYVLSTSFDQAIQMYSNMYVNVLLQTIMVFIFVKSHSSQCSCKNSVFINKISKYSLGIYAIHVVIINVVYEILDYVEVDSAYVTVPIVFSCAFIVAFIICLFLGKIRWFKQFVM